MSFGITLAVLLIALALAAGANYLERRPRVPGNPPLVSWTAIQIVAVVVAILMAAHLVSLLSGTPLVGRLMR